MKTVAIIAEFNPFHNGHAYLIDYARRALSADQVLIAMSGNFVQRGEPAVFDKFTRARMALSCGADLVLELPAVFSVSSAREFARAGVALIEKTGVADILLFGAEGNGLSRDALSGTLSAASGLLCAEAEAPLYQSALSAGLRAGRSYPRAREAALTAAGLSASEAALLSSSNNILALEYLQALSERQSGLIAEAALRLGDAYLSETPSGSVYASATALRGLLRRLSGGPLPQPSPGALREQLLRHIPSEAHPVLSPYLAQPERCVFPEALSAPFQYRLLSLNAAGADLRMFYDVSREIADRLSRSAERLCGFPERVEALWTKQYTRSRISRALLHIFLGITEETVARMKENDYVPCLRLLGFSENGRALLPLLKRNAAVPLVTRAADHRALLSEEIRISNLYYALKAGTVPDIPNELQRELARPQRRIRNA